MRRISVLMPLIVSALCAMPVDAAAQARARGGAAVQGQAVPRSAPAQQSAPAPRQAAPAPRSGPAPGTAPPPRSGPVGRFAQPSAPPAPAAGAAVPAGRPQRAASPPFAPPRRTEFGSTTAVPRTNPRAVVPQSAARVVVPQAIVPRAGQVQVYRGGRLDHRDFWPDYRPNFRRVYRPVYRPNYGGYFPYYTFRPSIRIGFGLWAGHPIRYPYAIPAYPVTYYVQPSPYPFGTPPYPYPSATYQGYPSATYQAPRALPGSSATPGGLSFDITPSDADLYIDGQFIGVVGQYSPNEPPLWLAPGRHLVEIREPGYEYVAFYVDIVAGQIIPYEGDLQQL